MSNDEIREEFDQDLTSNNSYPETYESIEGIEIRSRAELTGINLEQHLKMSALGCMGTAIVQYILFLYGASNLATWLGLSIAVFGWLSMWILHGMKWRSLSGSRLSAGMIHDLMSDSESFRKYFPLSAHKFAPIYFLIFYLVAASAAGYAHLAKREEQNAQHEEVLHRVQELDIELKNMQRELKNMQR